MFVMRDAGQMKSIALVLGATIGCGGGGDGEATALPKASYRVEALTTAPELGEVFAFNANGRIVSHSTAHGWIVVDLSTRVFTQITGMTGFVGFNDAGDLLYSDDRVGATRYILRHGNGAGAEEDIPRVLADGVEFRPFTLANDGGIWGFTERINAGAAVTPGTGRYAGDHVEQFRDWAGHEPTNDLGQGPRGVDVRGRAVFCETPAQSGEGGLALTRCRIAAADNTLIDLGTDVPDYWSVLTLQPITPGGHLGGAVAVGINGFGGIFPALFDDGSTEILGEHMGEVIALTDRGDVVFTQLRVDQPLRVRGPDGVVRDLTPYVINPFAPDAEPFGNEVLAVAPDGRMLVQHGVPGSADPAVDLLTPE